jgi:uncharacterized protein (TIGR02147 family)
MRLGNSPRDVIAYDDYRAYLRDVYTDRKHRGLSHRALARRAGLSSPSFLKAVMDGQRNLAPPTAKRVAAALGLSGDAAEYFSWLVVSNQTTDAAERRSALGNLRRLRRYQDVHALREATDAYHRHWYLPAIRELSWTSRFRADPQWIARVLTPSIQVQEARQALATLQQLKLLRPDAAGVLRATSQHVGTELEPNSDQVAAFHRAMIARATEAISSVPRPQRDISSITLSVDTTGLAGLKRRLQEVRRELLDEFDAGRSGSQILQVNFQLFPLSEDINGESEDL